MKKYLLFLDFFGTECNANTILFKFAFIFNFLIDYENRKS